MRIILLYDLPMQDGIDQKKYNKFHKWIIRRGYIMLQYSVYFKTITASQKYLNEVQALKNNLPANGNIRTLLVAENQFLNMKLLSGQHSINEKYNGMERYIRIEDDSEE